MKYVIGSFATMAVGILFALFVPGSYNGHSISTVGWVVAGCSLLSALAATGFVIRQQNTDKKIYSSMLGSRNTRLFMGDGRDHIQSDDMIDRR